MLLLYKSAPHKSLLPGEGFCAVRNVFSCPKVDDSRTFCAYVVEENGDLFSRNSDVTYHAAPQSASWQRRHADRGRAMRAPTPRFDVFRTIAKESHACLYSELAVISTGCPGCQPRGEISDRVPRLSAARRNLLGGEPWFPNREISRLFADANSAYADRSK